jgi:hypothetical protein
MQLPHMKTLRELEGSTIALLSPFLDTKIFQEVKLHKVEDGGIWIDSQKLTDASLGQIGVAVAPKTLIFFLPWHQVLTIMSSADEVTLSEKGFDL